MVDDGLQDFNEALHIIAMQTGRRFIEDVEGLARRPALQLGR
jgi:hypothetical protein